MPHLLDELVLTYKSSLVFDQVLQYFISLGSQVNGLAGLRKAPARQVEAKFSEKVNSVVAHDGQGFIWIVKNRFVRLTGRFSEVSLNFPILFRQFSLPDIATAANLSALDEHRNSRGTWADEMLGAHYRPPQTRRPRAKEERNEIEEEAPY